MTKEIVGQKPKLWKDYLGKKQVTAFGEAVTSVYPRFNLRGFLSEVVKADCYAKELKERINCIADILFELLPEQYTDKIDVLIKTAPSVGTFENWILTACIERHGVEQFEHSVQAMKELTQYGTCEFAIRPYLLRYEKKMMPILHQWADDKNEHVRRLVAEGTRPRGVWMQRIPSFIDNPTTVIALLEKLKADQSLYVRKAVANSLNDISKDHPDIAIKTTLRWQREKNPQTDWIIKRGCRTLIKQGNPKAFKLFGFTASPELTVEIQRADPKHLKIGSTIQVSVLLCSQSKSVQKLAVDYRLHYVKKNGKSLPKLFKLSECILGPCETHRLTIRRSLADMSTRKHYVGNHKIEIVVNGCVMAETLFVLID